MNPIHNNLFLLSKSTVLVHMNLTVQLTDKVTDLR